MAQLISVMELSVEKTKEELTTYLKHSFEEIRKIIKAFQVLLASLWLILSMKMHKTNKQRLPGSSYRRLGRS